MKRKYRDRSLLEDIYDYLKETALSPKQVDGWAELSREHAKQSRRDLGKYLRDKNMEWDPQNKCIRIGEHIVLTLTIV